MRTVSEAPSGRRFRSNRSLASCWGDEFGSDGQVPGYDFVYGCFDVGYFFIGRGLWQGKVEFAFLAFNVCRYGSAASEEVDHGTVYDGGYSVLLCPLS